MSEKSNRWLIAVITEGGKRMRCIGYVAMARRLLIDLKHYLEYWVVTGGTRLVNIVK